ncbi:MAG: c-type cytochrome biogenesis protein CcsB [Desulfamplus sp.]|nr:c-type cytochrome biogenesis protein CcsB [Desulfamplus sp.]
MAAYFLYLFKQKETLQNRAFGLVCAGTALHFTGTAFSTFAMGALPAHNLQQTLLTAALALSSVFIILKQKFNLKILGLFATPLIVLMMSWAMVLPDTAPAGDPFLRGTTFLKGFWLTSHIVLIFAGEAALALACGAGILYLIQEKAIKEKKRGFFYKRLPSLDLLDSTSYISVITGFTMLTMGLITGLIYAKTVWGSFWQWDPKEIWSAVTWLIYAALLHGRLTSGWRGKKSAMMTILGFAVLIFTFFGVNMLIGGHHQTFTK